MTVSGDIEITLPTNKGVVLDLKALKRILASRPTFTESIFFCGTLASIIRVSLVGEISKIVSYYDTHAKALSKGIQDWVSSFDEPTPTNNIPVDVNSVTV